LLASHTTRLRPFPCHENSFEWWICFSSLTRSVFSRDCGFFLAISFHRSTPTGSQPTVPYEFFFPLWPSSEVPSFFTRRLEYPLDETDVFPFFFFISGRVLLPFLLHPQAIFLGPPPRPCVLPLMFRHPPPKGLPVPVPTPTRSLTPVPLKGVFFQFFSPSSVFLIFFQSFPRRQSSLNPHAHWLTIFPTQTLPSGSPPS